MALVKVLQTGNLVQFADKHAEVICRDYPTEYELVKPVKINLADLPPIEKKNQEVIVQDVVTDKIIEPKKKGRPAKI